MSDKGGRILGVECAGCKRRVLLTSVTVPEIRRLKCKVCKSRASDIFNFARRASAEVWAFGVQQTPNTPELNRAPDLRPRTEHQLPSRQAQTTASAWPKRSSVKAKGVPIRRNKATVSVPALGTGEGLCLECGEDIPFERLKAVPGTPYCVSCASKRPEGQRNRKVLETWGSRSDWKKDRSSWKRSH
jgi:hypothetical protein